jgi:hypothetical protein
MNVHFTNNDNVNNPGLFVHKQSSENPNGAPGAATSIKQIPLSKSDSDESMVQKAWSSSSASSSSGNEGSIFIVGSKKKGGRTRKSAWTKTVRLKTMLVKVLTRRLSLVLKHLNSLSLFLSSSTGRRHHLRSSC